MKVKSMRNFLLALGLALIVSFMIFSGVFGYPVNLGYVFGVIFLLASFFVVFGFVE